MEFFNNGSRGWEMDTCPIVSQIVLAPPFAPTPNLGIFAPAQTQTNSPFASSDNEKWGQRGFKIVTALAGATKLEELLG